MRKRETRGKLPRERSFKQDSCEKRLVIFRLSFSIFHLSLNKPYPSESP